MKVEKVFIEDIKIGNRRREEFGDLQKLADSIGRRGLFQPIVITQINDELHLVAGERRLRAHRDILGWKEIEARFYSDLTDDERLEIELEENDLRLDLTPYERSKNLVKLAETAVRVLTESVKTSEGEVLPTAGKTSKGGRPAKSGVSKEAVAERVNKPRQTIERATEHVKAVEDFPELAVVAPTQKDAITVAKNLRALPEGERSEARSRLLKHDQGVLAHLAEKPPMPAPRQRLEKSAGSKWREWLNETRVRLASIFNTGTAQLTRQWSNAEYDAFLEDLRGFRADLDHIISDLEEQENELKQQAG